MKLRSLLLLALMMLDCAPARAQVNPGTSNYFIGAFGLSAVISPTALSGDVNDYAPTGLSGTIIIRQDGGAADRNITGLSGGIEGRIVQIINVGTTNNLVLKNQSASSIAANRFLISADVTLGVNRAVVLRYDGVTSRWRLFTGSTSTASLGLNQVVLGGGPGADPFSIPCATAATVLHGGSPPACSGIVGADLPNPSASTLGAMFSSAAVTNQFITSINTDGTVSRASPVNNFNMTTTASTGGTITMTAASTGVQVLTGSLTETYQLPDARTLVSGQPFIFNNNAAGNLTIKDGGAVTQYTLLYGGLVQAFVLDNSTAAGSWDFHAWVPNTASWGAFGLTLNDEYLKMLGPISTAAWTTAGARIGQDDSTLTDTTSSGTVAEADTNVLGGNTIAATNPTTFTNYASLKVKAPVAGTNVTLSSAWAALLDSLKVNNASFLAGGLTVQTGFTATGLVTNASLANMANSTIKCRTTAGTGAPEDCTATQARTILEQGTTLLAVLTASSSANLSDTTHFTSSFDDYMITFNNIVPATNSVGFNCLYHSGGVFPATTYVNNAGGSTTFVDITAASATVANTAGGGVTGTMYLRNVNSTTVNKFFDGRTYALLSGGGLAAVNPVGIWNGAQTAIDGIQCQFTSGNIATGNIKIYGLRSAL